MLTIKMNELPNDGRKIDGDLLQKLEEEHTAVVPRNRSLEIINSWKSYSSYVNKSIIIVTELIFMVILAKRRVTYRFGLFGTLDS